MIARRQKWVIAACLCSVAACLALGVAAAGAALPSRFGERNEEGGAGQFFEPRGVAIDQASGSSYLADEGDYRVDEFGPEGEFVRAWGWGVATGASEFQTCTTACRPGLPGSGVGQFSILGGLAVDGHGDVYVLDSGNSRVEKFGPDGEFLLMFGKGVDETGKGDVCEGKPGEECGPGRQGLEPGELFISASIAVDASGTVYVGDYGRVEQFSETGAFAGQFPVIEEELVEGLAANAGKEVYVVGFGQPVRRYDAFGSEVGTPLDPEGNARAVALGPGGHVFVDNGIDEQLEPHLLEYDSLGNEVASFDSGTEGGSKGIAFGEAVEKVYVLGFHAVHLAAVPAPGPVVAAESVSELLPGGATLGALVDPEGNETSYHFEYGTSEAYGNTTQSSVLTGGLFENLQADAAVTGLQPETSYHFRVVATDSQGHTTYGPDTTFTTPPPVLIDSESVSQVTAESAQLRVDLNPQGSATEYRFEYGPTTAYGERAPAVDASAGEGVGDVSSSVVVEGLSPGTAYHYRVVAHNAFGEVQGNDGTFTTSTANSPLSLADGRRWEMVSPSEKSGVSLESQPEEGGLIESSENGQALTYVARGPFDQQAPGARAPAYSQMLARREAGGWRTQDITTPHDEASGFAPSRRAEYRAFSLDLSRAVVEPEGATALSPLATEHTPYLRESDGEYVPLVTASNVANGVKFGGEEIKSEHFINGVEAVEASEDALTVALTAPLALTPDFVQPEGNLVWSLYSWHDGSISLVSWLPGTEQSPQETPAAAAGLSSTLGRGSDEQMMRHSISRDGNRIFYTLSGESGLHTHLYVRDVNSHKSVQLDLAEGGVPNDASTAPVGYQDASVDGSVAFFTDEVPLVSNASASPRVQSADLYECDLLEVSGALHCALKDVTVPIAGGERADVRGDVIGSDEGAEKVYFVANGRLTPNAVRGDCERESAQSEGAVCNLYEYDRGSDSVRLVAVLSESDRADWGESGNHAAHHMARVSPDGRYLTFMSQRSLTGYDNRDSAGGARDQEVYEYDALKDKLRCISCAPTGSRPTGAFESGQYPGLLVDRTRAFPSLWLAATVPDWTRSTAYTAPYQSRYLLDDGRVFFDSRDSLVPQDVNGQWDVYEYEPDGVGSCESEEGCTSLISSGRSPSETAFLDASRTGPGGQEAEDVFFLTAQALSPRDVDSLLDVYDAHICSTASPCASEGAIVTPSCEQIESCRSSGAIREGALAPPASTVMSAFGNLPAPRRTVDTRSARANRLARALAACRKKRGKRRRQSCETRELRKYKKRQASKNGANHRRRK